MTRAHKQPALSELSDQHDQSNQSTLSISSPKKKGVTSKNMIYEIS
ncbi:hypothetical protein HMPREF1870_01553 [Bacteroidales bacterium KA00344]|nr:hypothetical protein HMPREF1870_01553 [Bacteroidales bacterium KA00344]